MPRHRIRHRKWKPHPVGATPNGARLQANRYVQMSRSPDPSAAEIAAQCAAFRATWTPLERLRRSSDLDLDASLVGSHRVACDPPEYSLYSVFPPDDD